MADPSTGSGQASEDEAARAFEDLRAELSLLRRAVERLTAERTELPEGPDYSETLGVISQMLSATAQRVDTLVRSPALSLTPEVLNRQIVEAGVAGRIEDRRAIAAARQVIEEVATKMGRQLDSHIMADEQRRHASAVASRRAGLSRSRHVAVGGPRRSDRARHAGKLAMAGMDGGADASHADVGRRSAADACRVARGVCQRGCGQSAGGRQPRCVGRLPQAGWQGKEGGALRDPDRGRGLRDAPDV